MNYPLELVEIELPLGLQQMYVPALNSVRETYDSGDMDSFPYWAQVWPSSIALSAFIQEHPGYVSQKRVLEIAAGLGLPSLVASASASSVFCTDKDEDAMRIAVHSAEVNGISNMQCRVLDWNALPAELIADTVLLSDVNYDDSEFPVLVQLIERLLNAGSVILLATPQRLVAKSFVQQLAAYCKHAEVKSVATNNGEVAISILVLQGR